MGYSFNQRIRKRQAPEAHLLLSVLKYLDAAGWDCGKVKVKGSFTTKGTFIFDRYLMRGLPDALAFKGSRMLAIETKAGANSLTAEQERFKKNFHFPPYREYVEVRSLADIEAILDDKITL